MIIARGLGPGEYGRFSFLLVTFTALKSLIDLGTSSVFFTLISQKPRSKIFILYYWGFILVQFIISLFVLFVILPKSFLTYIWGVEEKKMLLIAFFASFVQGLVWNVSSQMAEASKKSLDLQKINTFLLTFYLLGILICMQLKILTISFIFISIIVEWSVASFLAFKLYNFAESFSENANSTDTLGSVFSEFMKFGVPLGIVSLLTFLHETVDRSLLQKWGGSINQGFFSIAQQFSVVSLLATTSILRIFWKEIAEAYHNEKGGYVQILYLKTSRYLFVFSCVISGILIQFIPEIIKLTIGTEYKDAEPVFIIMFLYPIHQSLGQLTTTLLLSTGKTKTYSVVTSVSMCFSIMSIPFLLSPNTEFIYGLGLGAFGLALKYFVIQFFTVNILLYIISREFNWKYDWAYQFYTMGGFILLGYIIKRAYFLVNNLIFPDIVNMAIISLFYFLACVIFILMFPHLIIMTRDEIIAKIKLLRTQF